MRLAPSAAASQRTVAIGGPPMWIETLSHWVVVAALLAQTPAGSTSAAPALPESIVTRHPVFAIPFRVAPSADSAKQVVEVQLHVSTDRGAHWQQYAKAPTTQQQFLFHSEGDGEYWFVIRTLDRSGQVRPETIATPGLRVVVDSRPPTLTLTTQRQQPGQMTVRWETDELHPKPNTLAIQYRALPNGPWQPLAIHPQDADKPTGEVVLRLKPGENDIQLRGEVADTAGNIGFGHAQSRPGDVNSRPTGIADAQTPARTLRPCSPPAPTPRPPRSPRARWRSISIRPLAIASHRRRSRPISGWRYPACPPANGRGWSTRGSSSWSTTSIRSARRALGGSSCGAPATAGRRGAASPPIRRQPQPAAGQRRRGGHLRVPRGRDQRRGPRRQTAQERRSARPLGRRRSDQAHRADRLGPAGRRRRGGTVDYLLAGRRQRCWPPGRSRSRSARAHGGPWLPIASGLENTGRYAWPIDNRTPPQFYLRLEVRDEAGNVGVHETTEPVTIDQSRPTVRIRDVRPRS